jgi:spermidine synthase
MFTAGLGHDVAALLGVMSAFLGGLAVGAWSLDRPISRSPGGGRWYGCLELVIGTWGAVSALLIPAVNQLSLAWIGPEASPLRQWLVIFVLPFVTLLPATAAMGATLPAMDRLLSAQSKSGRCLGALYAANTLGAVVGTLGSVFVVMPALGFRASLCVFAGLNLFCGTVILAMQTSRVVADRQAAKGPERSYAHPDKAALSFRRIGLLVFATGLLGIGFELAIVRSLSQVFENTIYSYAAALAVFLIGTALGAACYQRWGSGRPVRPTLAGLLGGTASAGLIAITLLRGAPWLYRSSREAFGDTVGAVLAAEMIVAALAFGLPTIFMGALFSHLVQNARGPEGGIGRAAALNTLGCALAAVAIGVALLPALGMKWTLITLAGGYLLLLPQWTGRPWIAVLLTGALGFAMSTDLNSLARSAGTEVVAYREGTMASVAVVRTPDGHRSLRVNHRLQMGGTAAAVAERRQAHIPLLLHPDPKRALFLGPGTGITLGAAGAYPGLMAEGVELLPEVKAMMQYFEPENSGPNLRVQVADARRFVRTTTNRYDVIVADLFHPAQDGAGFLYTREHFQAVRDRLRPGGLFCQWLPLHQLDEAVLRSIVRTFLETFSDTHAFLLHFNVDIPALALIGTLDPLHLPANWFEQRSQDNELRARLREAGLDRALNLLGCHVAGPEDLRRFAAEALPATDDFPVVLFAAPRFSVRRDTPPHELLLTLLAKFRAEPRQFVDEVLGRDDKLSANLAAFIAARDVYLKGLVAEGNGDLSMATEAYLESARRSLFFVPAYARLVGIIQVLVNTDRERARQLFQRLEEAQPAQPLGRTLLGPLFEEPARNK